MLDFLVFFFFFGLPPYLSTTLLRTEPSTLPSRPPRNNYSPLLKGRRGHSLCSFEIASCPSRSSCRPRCVIDPRLCTAAMNGFFSLFPAKNSGAEIGNKTEGALDLRLCTVCMERVAAQHTLHTYVQTQWTLDMGGASSSYK